MVRRRQLGLRSDAVIENAEIAGTLVALAVPSLKPLFGSFLSHLSEYTPGHSYLKDATGVGHNNNGASKRLLGRSRTDDYEMMPSETLESQHDRLGNSIVPETSGIKVTKEVNTTKKYISRNRIR